MSSLLQLNSPLLIYLVSHGPSLPKSHTKHSGWIFKYSSESSLQPQKAPFHNQFSCFQKEKITLGSKKTFCISTAHKMVQLFCITLIIVIYQAIFVIHNIYHENVIIISSSTVNIFREILRWSWQMIMFLHRHRLLWSLLSQSFMHFNMG